MRSINFTKVIAREEENDESEPNEAGPDLVVSCTRANIFLHSLTSTRSLSMPFTESQLPML